MLIPEGFLCEEINFYPVELQKCTYYVTGEGDRRRVQTSSGVSSAAPHLTHSIQVEAAFVCQRQRQTYVTFCYC